MKNKEYAIVDLETTGGRASRNRITEVGIVVYDGEKVVETFESLINPEIPIPANITRLTGISDEMVAGAPKFYEVARKVVELTQDRIFVAHNSRFDYDFLREEYRRLGYTFSRKQLCTVRLTRKIYPGLPSYSLGNLTRHFGIDLKNHHRALADATATTELLKLCLAGPGSEEEVKAFVNRGITETKLPKNLKLSQIEDLPEDCGVYYFHDLNGEVVYVGKSKNIRSRVAQHFNDRTPKGQKIAERVADITYELTGSELVALLHESEEIKRLQPTINRALRRTKFDWAIVSRRNDKGYTVFDIIRNSAKARKEENIINYSPSLSQAKGRINKARQEFELCGKLTGTSSGTTACFHFHLKQCRGACVERESVDEYNRRAGAAEVRLTQVFGEDFLLFDRGRTHDEESVVLVRDGGYQGFAFISKDEAHDVTTVVASIRIVRSHPDTGRIIQRYLSDKGGRMVDLKTGKRKSLV